MLALDLDGFLADTQGYMNQTRLSHLGFGLEQFTDWSFGHLASHGITRQRAIDLLLDVWRTDWSNVSLIDPNVPHVVNYLLRTYGGNIVTANPEPNVLSWLESHRINPNFVVVENGDKTRLPYVVFGEDNPYIEVAKKILPDEKKHANLYREWKGQSSA